MAKPSRVSPLFAPSPGIVRPKAAAAVQVIDHGAPDLPDLATVKKRLATAKGRSRPWLTAAGFKAAQDAPEIMGPKTYHKG